MIIMSVVRFLIVLGVGSLFSWGAWVMILLSLNPFASGWIAPALFFASFFLGWVGTITIAEFFLRYWLEKDNILYRQIGTSFRQAVVLSTGATAALILQSARLLNLWSGGLIILLVVTIEFFFLAGQTRRPGVQT